MTECEHITTDAAARVSAFENHLELMLMGLRIMRQNGQSDAEIADRLTAAWQQIGLAMTGRAIHQAPGAMQ